MERNYDKYTVLSNKDIAFAIKAGMVTESEVKLFFRMFKIARDLRGKPEHGRGVTVFEDSPVFEKVWQLIENQEEV